MTKRTSVLTVGIWALFAATAYADDATPAKWAPWIDAEWDPGSHRSIGQFDGFAPVMQDETSLIFVNPRMRFDDQDSQEYNWGLGYRQMVDKEWILGGYTYVDRNISGFNNEFQEVTLGLEAISEDFKLRANDYQPYGVRSYSGQNPNVIATSGTLEIQSNTERSMQGDDVEAGYRIPMNKANAPDQLWVYGGGYRFSAPDMRTIEGPRARFEYEIGDVTVADRNLRLRLSGEYEHDGVRGTQWFAGIRVGIPLDDSGSSDNTSKLTPLERHMIDPVQRDVDIVTNTGATKTEAAINSYNNEPVSGVTTVNANTSNVASAVTSAGVNSIVVFDGSGGTITIPTNTSVNMLNGQSLLGGGSFLTLHGANSGVQAVYYAPGSTPTITGSTHASDNGLVNLDTNSVVNGLSITNNATYGGASAIYSGGVTHFTIAHNTITDTTDRSDGIDINGGSGLIDDNTITKQGRYTIRINIQSASQIAARNNTINMTTLFSDSGYPYGVYAANAQHTVISGNNITIARGTGVFATTSPSVNINHNIISDGIFGVILNASDRAVINGNTINEGGLRLENSSGVSVNNNIIGGNYGAVVFFGTTSASGNGNVFSGATPCVDATSSDTGNISFVDSRHCP